MLSDVFIHRVKIENFKSIASCDVELRRLNFLIGPNGAGKSNFLDAIRFCRDSLTGPLDQAFSLRRSNLHSMRHRAAGNDSAIKFEFDAHIQDVGDVRYEFSLSALSPFNQILFEECRIGSHSFVRHNDIVEMTNNPNPPAILPNRLYLSNASGLEPYRALYEKLASCEFYQPDPYNIRLDTGDTGSEERLESDCDNLALIFDDLTEESKVSVVERLCRIVPSLTDVTVAPFHGRRFLRFKHCKSEFFANEMSDGTLRSLAILVAVFQNDVRSGVMPLIAFEEPETALHPGALGVLLEAIQEASQFTQVIVTSQSSDLLDNADITADSLVAAEMRDGATVLGSVDSASREVLRDRLFTPGELMRSSRIEPQVA
jgi:predicted ATPase